MLGFTRAPTSDLNPWRAHTISDPKGLQTSTPQSLTWMPPWPKAPGPLAIMVRNGLAEHGIFAPLPGKL